VIGQRRINKRFLPVEGFCGATTRETISVNVRLDHFGEEFGNRTQPEPVSPVPSIQRLPKHELRSGEFYTHFSLLKSIEGGFDLPCLNHACDNNVQVMSDLFGDSR
jgi:hypothetical protein